MKKISAVQAFVFACSLLLLATGSSPGQNTVSVIGPKTYTINQKDTVSFAPSNIAIFNRIDLLFKTDTANVVINLDYRPVGATTWLISAGDTLTFNGNGTQWKTWVVRDNVTELIKGTYVQARLRVNWQGTQCGDGTRKYTAVAAYR